jgi:hypothetical protein
MQLYLTRTSKKKKKKRNVGNWNDKFQELSNIQITTTVVTLVAEYQFLCEELLLNKKTNFKIAQERQENSQSVLASPATHCNFGK